jgi:hypothetical protein
MSSHCQNAPISPLVFSASSIRTGWPDASTSVARLWPPITNRRPAPASPPSFRQDASTTTDWSGS